jgi:ribosomal protein S18 acetylase RimI-like enzyme
MEIRYGRRRDLKAAAALLNACWRWAYKDILDAEVLAGLSDKGRYKRLLKGYREGKRPLLLFGDDGALLGICRFGKSRTPGYPDDGEIGAIYLREDAVGRGCGHALLTRAEEELRARGYRNLVLDVLSQNARAIAFYTAHGYVKAGDSTFTREGKEYPLDIMRKELT